MCLAGLAPRRVDYCKGDIVNSRNSNTVEQRESIEVEHTVLNLGHCDGFVVKTEEGEIWSTVGVGCLRVDQSKKNVVKSSSPTPGRNVLHRARTSKGPDASALVFPKSSPVRAWQPGPPEGPCVPIRLYLYWLAIPPILAGFFYFSFSSYLPSLTMPRSRMRHG